MNDKPKYKEGDRLEFVWVDNRGREWPMDDNMVVSGEPHKDERGEWQYDIVGKANPSPESLLKPYPYKPNS